VLVIYLLFRLGGKWKNGAHRSSPRSAHVTDATSLTGNWPSGVTRPATGRASAAIEATLRPQPLGRGLGREPVTPAEKILGLATAPTVGVELGAVALRDGRFEMTLYSASAI